MTYCTVTKRYHFEAGHFLPKVPAGHKCARQHGHNYVVEVSLYGAIREDGMVLDFFDLDKAVHPLIEKVDHRNLNDIDGLRNPTAELIAIWFHTGIADALAGTAGTTVKVFETPDCWASFPS